MRILVLNGSPDAQGKTKQAVELFLDGMFDHAELFHKNDPALYCSFMNLAWMQIAPCTRCGMCKANPGKCILKDAGQHILNSAKLCGVYVIATPVYAGGVSGILKVAADRLYAHDPSVFSGKKMVLITEGCSRGDERGHQLIESQMELLCERLNMAFVASHHIPYSETDAIPAYIRNSLYNDYPLFL